MATTKEEPWVKVSEEIVNNPPSVVGDDQIVIGGVIIAPCGPALAQITSGTDFLNKYTTDGTIPRNAHISFLNAYYLSQITPLVIARATNAKLLGGVIIHKEGSAKCYFDENNDVLKYSKEISIPNIPVDDSGNLGEFNLAIEDIIVYAGTMPELSETTNLYEVVTIDDLITVLTSIGGYYFENFSTSTKTNIATVTAKVYSQQPTLAIGDVSTSTEEDAVSNVDDVDPIELDLDENIPEEADWIFAMIGQEYSNSDYIKFNFKKSGTRFLLELLDNVNSGRYYISFDPNHTDSTGASDYADTLNDLGFNFNVVIYGNAQSNADEFTASLTNVTFGESSYNAEASASSTNVNNALETIVDQELYDIDGLCLFGLQITSDGATITKQFCTIGPDNKWLTPVGVPYVYTNRRTIANWVESLGLPEPSPVPGAIVLGPFDKDTSTVGWTFYVDPGVKYWERVVTNANANQEFAPVFKDTYGEMNMTSPTLLLKKDDRELLLARSKPINWVIQNARTGVYYLNQNWTYSNDDNVCEEENVVRTVWKISRDLNPILEQFFAHYNTRSTRQSVYDLIDYYFRWNIMNQNFHPDEYNIVCDNSNNPDEIIRAHKMQVLVEVRYNPSIKWITAINRAYPIGVDFSGEM